MKKRTRPSLKRKLARQPPSKVPSVEWIHIPKTAGGTMEKVVEARLNLESGNIGYKPIEWFPRGHTTVTEMFFRGNFINFDRAENASEGDPRLKFKIFECIDTFDEVFHKNPQQLFEPSNPITDDQYPFHDEISLIDRNCFRFGIHPVELLSIVRNPYARSFSMYCHHVLGYHAHQGGEWPGMRVHKANHFMRCNGIEQNSLGIPMRAGKVYTVSDFILDLRTQFYNKSFLSQTKYLFYAGELQATKVLKFENFKKEAYDWMDQYFSPLSSVELNIIEKEFGMRHHRTITRDLFTEAEIKNPKILLTTEALEAFMEMYEEDFTNFGYEV